jgi:hypothetical protein
LPLSEPVRVGDLPCYGDFPVLTFLMKIFSPFRPGHQLIIPGNDEIGIYSCDKLELVLDPTSPLSPPPQQLAAPLARSADALSWTERTH